HTELDETLVPVTGHRVQLQQVLFNLVTNAIEAMESVADRMMLIKSGLESSGEVRVTVEDSGSGIDPENIDQIFGSWKLHAIRTFLGVSATLAYLWALHEAQPIRQHSLGAGMLSAFGP